MKAERSAGHKDGQEVGEKALQIVIDTNVLISAALSAHSSPAHVVNWALAHARILFSSATFAELETRLWKPKFDRYLTIERRQAVLHGLNAAAVWLEPQAGAYASYSRDADDDKFIHLALAGQADWLVSGDQDLLELAPRFGPDAGLEILSPAQAVARMA